MRIDKITEVMIPSDRKGCKMHFNQHNKRGKKKSKLQNTYKIELLK